MNTESLIAIITSVGALLTVLFTQLRKSKCTHVDVCHGFLTVEREVDDNPN